MVERKYRKGNWKSEVGCDILNIPIRLVHDTSYVDDSYEDIYINEGCLNGKNLGQIMRAIDKFNNFF